MKNLIRITLIASFALCFERLPMWFMPQLSLADAAEMTVQKHTDVIPDAQSAKELTKKTAVAKSVVDAKNVVVNPPIEACLTSDCTPPVSVALLDPTKDHHKGHRNASFPTLQYSYISGNNQQVSISSGKKDLTISWHPVWDPPIVNGKPSPIHLDVSSIVAQFV